MIVSEKVFIVDDEPDLLRLYQKLLEDHGYKVKTATSGEEALEKIGDEQPDLVISDVVMQKMTGFELSRGIKDAPETTHIPVILFSVLSRNVDKEMSLRSGAEKLLSKSINRETFLEEISHAIEESKVNNFSVRFNMSHDDIKNKLFILEYDRLSHYEKLVRSFIIECKTNDKEILLLSTKDSPLYARLYEQEEVEVHVIEEHTMLTPILDEKNEGFSLIFDSITLISLALGFTFSYELTRQLRKRLLDKKATAMFLLNSDAQAKEEIAKFNSLFANHLAFKENKPEILKWI
ncbi:response regulator [Candidatus Bathyarchaeota archaeon]|nr:response regulator [Candidatus Bathyarchaeota archaeon]